MASFTITIPDAQLTRVLDGIAALGGWNAALGVTKAQFAKRWIRDQIRRAVRDGEIGALSGTVGFTDVDVP